jgi:ABC-2 type transport system ATP-binding protein
LATLVEPTSGTVSIAGVNAFSNLKQVRPSIGYIPVGFEGYPELSVIDYLNFFAAAYKLNKRERATAIDAVLELMDIEHLRDIKIGILSTGERQRLLLAKTFLHEPELWLLDEPLTPLDPGGQVEMIALLEELQSMGKTVVVATNRLEDVSRLCGPDSQDEKFIGILSGGGFAVFKTFRELREGAAEVDSTESLSPNWLNELYE